MGLSPGYAIQSLIFLCTCCIALTSMRCFKGIVSWDFRLQFFLQNLTALFSFVIFEYLQSHPRLASTQRCHALTGLKNLEKLSLEVGKTSNKWWQPSRVWIFSHSKPAKEHYYNISYFFPTILYLVFVTSLAWYTRTINGMKYKFVYLYLAKLSPRRGLPYMYTSQDVKVKGLTLPYDDCAVQTILGLE